MMQDQRSSIFRWSTRDIPRSEKLDCYVETFCKGVMNVTISSAENENFFADVTLAPLGNLCVGVIGGSKQISSRTRADIARGREHAYNLILGLKATWRWWNSNSSLCMRPGGLVLGDSRVEHAARWTTDFLAMNVRLPIDWLYSWVPEPHRLVGKRIDGESKWGRALSSYIAQITPELATNPPVPMRVVADQVGAMLALVTSEIPGCVPEITPTYRDERDRILDCIRQRCSELQLTAVDVAASLGLSPRTLHRILAAFGMTFGKKLIDIRLDVAMRMIESRLFDRLTTAEIGIRAGFMDASHFARVCRQRIGRTPGELRRTRDS